MSNDIEQRAREYVKEDRTHGGMWLADSDAFCRKWETFEMRDIRIYTAGATSERALIESEIDSCVWKRDLTQDEKRIYYAGRQHEKYNAWNAALDAVLERAEKEVDTSTINGPRGGSCRTASELLQAIKRIIEELRK